MFFLVLFGTTFDDLKVRIGPSGSTLSRAEQLFLGRGFPKKDGRCTAHFYPKTFQFGVRKGAWANLAQGGSLTLERVMGPEYFLLHVSSVIFRVFSALIHAQLCVIVPAYVGGCGPARWAANYF